MNQPLPEQDDDGGYRFGGAMSVDADGANGADGSGRAAYGPSGTQPIDYLANAGAPGHWWGIVTDRNGNPIQQGPNDPAPGYYISTTSYQRSHDGEGNPLSKASVYRYLDSATEFFIVVPSHWRSLCPGIVLGCKATVTDNDTGQGIDGVVGDFGPRSHLGEASIAYAKAFGLSGNPKNGGTERMKFTYAFFPDVAADGYELQPM